MIQKERNNKTVAKKTTNSKKGVLLSAIASSFGATSFLFDLIALSNAIIPENSPNTNF
jgi:hypothetical protein